MIALSTELTIGHAESVIASLPNSPGELRLPVGARRHQFGGMGATVQALITWAKSTPNPRLVTALPDSDEARGAIESLLDKDHGLIAALIAEEILGKDGALITERVREVARARLAHLNRDLSGTQRGPKVLFLAVDGTPFAYPPLLYYPIAIPEVRSTSEFSDLAFEMIQRTAEFGKATRKRILEDLSEDIGPILFELFQNTHLWARTEFGRIIRRSVRGIRVELYRDLQMVFDSVLRDCPPLLRYVSETKSIDAEGRKYFVELSIFDAGTGLAQRWLNRRIPIRDEINSELAAVVDCLRLHSTSSKELHRGIGLPRVMALLTHLGGFLRIRTGRLALYRDFRREPFPTDSISPHISEPFLFDWTTESPTVTALPRAEGTLLTMVFPISQGGGVES
jgi:hypothetical protein